MTIFEKAKLIITPDMINTGKIYTMKPLTDPPTYVGFSRNGQAYRINQAGIYEAVANNVVRQDYENADCPSLLIEGQSTNLYLNSEPTAPEGLVSNITYEPYAWEKLGFTNCVRFTVGENTAYRYGGVGEEGKTYTLSFFVEMDDGSEPVVATGAGDSNGDFQIAIGGDRIVQNVQKKRVKGTNIWRVSDSKVLGSSSTESNGIVKYKGNSPKGFRVTGFQLEEGTEATSYIKTPGAIKTRPADVPQTISPPTGTTEIKEVFEDGSTNVITTIPTTYTIPNGRVKHIIFS